MDEQVTVPRGLLAEVLATALKNTYVDEMVAEELLDDTLEAESDRAKVRQLMEIAGIAAT